MQLKKVELTLDYGNGEEIEVRYFSAEDSNDSIKTDLLEGEYSYGPIPTINFVGEVDALEELGDNFKEEGGQYFTFKEWQAIMNDMMEGVCPGDPIYVPSNTTK